MRHRPASSLLSMLVLSLAVAGVGCPCNGLVNSSESLRWWLFSKYGAGRICPEILKRGVPIKIGGAGSNTVGRFFPQQCLSAINDTDHALGVKVVGHGYAFLPMARRVGFTASATVELHPDFRLEDEATYAWGRYSRMIEPPVFQITGAENGVVNLAFQTPMGNVASVLGQGIITSELSQGFTVVHTDDGDDFALGQLQPPQRPAHPLSGTANHVVLGADTTEVHPLGREYLGPFAIEAQKQAIFINTRVGGAPVSIYVTDKMTGDGWLAPYEAGQPLGAPPANPLLSGGAQMGDSSRALGLAPGLYYVVLENRTAPAPTPLGLPIPMPPILGGGESTAIVSYSIEVGGTP